jgi:lipoprotein-anchoring transpeptidase ErfK/SrfK
MPFRWRILVLALALAAAGVTLTTVDFSRAEVAAAPRVPLTKKLPPPVGEPPPPPAPQYPPLPADSGSGRRIVYSLDQQRVWIVETEGNVSGSWLVSGRKSIPKPGAYSIFSRSRWSQSEDGSVRMEFMLRFARTSGSAIGFHAIPVDRNGRPVQSEEELGQPRSRGCVRQARSDAEHLWNWAPDGTAVQVTA